MNDTLIEIGSRLELFVDDFLIDRFAASKLKMYEPVRKGAAIELDESWEGLGSFYPTVLSDDGSFRAYYRGKPITSRDGTDDEVTCYAESDDGIVWRKPRLGLCEASGSTENNVVFGGDFAPITHNFTPFIDSRPGVGLDERIKGLGGFFSPGPDRPGVPEGVFGFVSSDGVRWRRIADKPVLGRSVHPLHTDTAQCCCFWSKTENQYVCYIRMWYDDGTGRVRPGMGGNIRWIGRTTSPDFEHWAEAALVSFGDAPPEHLYTNQIQPYFRAPHIYLGFPYRFLPEMQIVPEHPVVGISDGVMISSRDGMNWDRTFLEAFIRPGRDRRNWTDRNMCIACGIAQTATDEISLYWIENYRHDTCRLERGTLRLDGFASLNGPYSGGEAVTHPFVFTGSELRMNYATSAAGHIRVELQEADGSPLAGFSSSEAKPLIGDEIEGVARWQGGTDVGRLAGRAVRARFVLHDADIFSIRFASA